MENASAGRVRAIFDAARRLPAADRDALLELRAGDDPALLAEVRALLRHEETVAELLDPLAPGIRSLGPGDAVGGRYLLGARLGEGAFGRVFRAHDRLAGRDVAVKVLPGAAAFPAGSWRREVATLRRSEIPGVVRLLDDGTEGPDAFLVMELVDGRPFPGPAGGSLTALADAAAALLRALGRLHASGVLHRDLKPANVLVGDDGRPVIVDLGMAREREEGRGGQGGTPAYLAPEVLLGRRPDVRADLYSAGVLLYEAVAGRRPHDAPNLVALIHAHRRPPVPLRELRPDVPERLAGAVHALLQGDPAARPADAEAAHRMLRGERPPSPLALPEGRYGWVRRERLVSLFEGPDRILHLREDAAEELSIRTGGRPEEIATELQSWIDSGLARREGERVVVERKLLDRLRAERETGTDPEAVWRLVHRGRLGEAVAAADLALAAGRRSPASPGVREADLLEPMLAAALGIGTLPALNLCVYHAERSASRDEDLAALEAAARAAILAVRGDAERALALRGVPREGKYARWGLTVRIFATRAGARGREAEVLAEAAAWARREGTREARGTLAGWTGWLRYGQGRYRAAAGLHVRGARLTASPHQRVNAWLSAASAAMEAGDHGMAEELADLARDALREFRHPHFEARAEWILRSVAYRQDQAGPPDRELVAAVERLGQANLEGLVTLTEAAAAWRQGDRAAAAELAGRAAERWEEIGHREAALLARALRAAAGPAPSEGEADALLARAAGIRVPGVRLQVAGLVARACPARKDRCRRLALSAARELPDEEWDRRREVLSPAEAGEFVE